MYGNEMVVTRDQRAGWGVLNALPNYWEYVHIYILLVLKCTPKFNFVCFAMSHFDWNHDKEKKLKVSDTLLNRKLGIPK
jgi:hypothetical protein